MRSISRASRTSSQSADCPAQAQSDGTWDAVPIPGVSVSELSQEALDAFRTMAVHSNRLSEAEAPLPNEPLLRKLNLYQGDQLKRAALLLFHPEPARFAAGAYIKVGKYKLVDDTYTYEDVLQFSDDVYGPLILQLNKTVDLLQDKYFVPLLSRGTPSVPVQMLPEDIVRELLINAIAHKDYASNIPIRVSVHEDRMYVFNAGAWPKGLPLGKRLYRKHESLPRNPLLTEIFYRAGMMEAWGTGFQRMKAVCKKTQSLEPIVKSKDGTVTAFAHCADDYWSLLDPSLTGIGSDPRLDMFNPEADFKEISRRMSIPIETMVRMVSKMFPDRDFSKVPLDSDYDEP